MFRKIIDYYLTGKRLLISVFFLLFSAIGIFLFFFSFHLRKEDKAFFERAVPVAVTVSEVKVEEKKDSEGNVKKVRKVYVDYEYEGREYQDIYLCNYEAGMEEGKPVDAFCDPENPNDVEVYYDVDQHYNEMVIISLFFAVVGALPIVLFTISALRRKE